MLTPGGSELNYCKRNDPGNAIDLFHCKDFQVFAAHIFHLQALHMHLIPRAIFFLEAKDSLFPNKMMLFHALYFLLLLIFPKFATTVAPTTPAYTATDFILLNCGASSNLNDTSRRTWDGDDRSRYAPWNAASISSASTASQMDPSVFQVPYQTARVFLFPFTYTFPVSEGPKFLRLYFYPNMYLVFNTSQYSFSVTANAFTLLRNFSALLNSPSPSQPSFMKEFVIHIGENQKLELTFSPDPNTFAFVNGIEIVSVPDRLYFPDKLYFLGNDVNHTTLENLYRLNVGGNIVEIQDDCGPTHGMFRAWYPDDEYIFGADPGWTPHRDALSINYTTQTPPYSAPEIVYTTSRVAANYSSSLDWLFPVDSRFYYMLRLHFCEIQLEVTEQNQRVFTISINNQIEEAQADVIYWTGGTEIPTFKDYIIWVPDDGRSGKQALRLSLTPNLAGNPKYRSALLNGLEIFKLNPSNPILEKMNPEPTMDSLPPELDVKPLGKRGRSVIYSVLGSVIGIFVVAAVGFLIFRRQRKVKASATAGVVKLRSTTRTSGSGVSLPSGLCRHFSLDEINIATSNFDDNFVIGKGGFGNVYKGFIDDGTTTVAIKRLSRLSNQGAHEFLTEIEMLSKLRHLHLVSLVGYCDENGEMILVYDYMSHGTLRDHLHNSENSPLTWKQRLQICVGAAKGLHYLHTGIQHAIIHRDVKSTNILLNEKWVAKISDFGLSKMEPPNDSFTHISTNVKGTFGYLDPEYFVTSKLTRKSDVYAFGVVLFEVLSRRPAVDIRLDEEQHSLARWARYCIQEGKVDRLIDNNLMGQISPACLEVFVGIAGRCLHTQPQLRPTMADVVRGLELALALQQTPDPTEQVEEEENTGRNYSDQSDGVISVDEITPPTEESDYSDRIISEDNPSYMDETEAAGRCSLGYGIDRPSMTDTVTRLEATLTQQDAT